MSRTEIQYNTRPGGMTTPAAADAVLKAVSPLFPQDPGKLCSLYVAVARKLRKPLPDGRNWLPGMHLLKDIPSIIRRAAKSFKRSNGNYISLGLFDSKNRKKASVAEISCIFLDCDFHKLGLSEQEGLEKIDSLISQYSLPPTNCRILSGQGAWCLWLIDTTKPRDTLQRNVWDKTIKRLVTAFAPVNADPACTDLSRVVRLPLSMNHKSGKQVQWLWSDRETRHSLSSLLLSLVSVDEPASARAGSSSMEQRKSSCKINPSTARRNPSRDPFWKATLLFLEQVAHSSYARQVGSRNTLVHLYRNALAQLGYGRSVSEGKTREFVQNYINSSNQVEIEEWIRDSTSAHELHERPGNDSPWEGYGYSSEGMLHKLTRLIPKEDARRLLASFRKKQRARKLCPREGYCPEKVAQARREREAEKVIKKTRVRSLILRSLHISVGNIQRLTGYSRGTVQRLRDEVLAETDGLRQLIEKTVGEVEARCQARTSSCTIGRGRGAGEREPHRHRSAIDPLLSDFADLVPRLMSCGAPWKGQRSRDPFAPWKAPIRIPGFKPPDLGLSLFQLSCRLSVGGARHVAPPTPMPMNSRLAPDPWRGELEGVLLKVRRTIRNVSAGILEMIEQCWPLYGPDVLVHLGIHLEGYS